MEIPEGTMCNKAGQNDKGKYLTFTQQFQKVKYL